MAKAFQGVILLFNITSKGFKWRLCYLKNLFFLLTFLLKEKVLRADL